MKHTITNEELRESWDQQVDRVYRKGDSLVVEQEGEPVAALVPLHVLEAYERNRRRLAEIMENSAARNRGVEPDYIERVIEQEIAASRSERRARQAKAAEQQG